MNGRNKEHGVAQDLRVSGLTRRYGDRVVVDGIDLSIEAGRFHTLLGPSGCGKTTTLRMIAGLEVPDGGAVMLGGRTLSEARGGLFVPPEQRGMGMVFQSYAVWPHMTVGGNVEFPLRLRSLSAAERNARVDEALEMVGLSAYRNSRATNLSGGQQQRVAIARALVYRPDVLLLDEPLSNLDTKLREQMRLELRELQRSLGTTTIMVTHDQDEAMVVSDHVVVMRDGRIEQTGTPEDVWFRPRSAFVMDFLGAANRLPARLTGPGLAVELDDVPGVIVSLPETAAMADLRDGGGGQVDLYLRAEDLAIIGPGGERPGDWPGRVEIATFLGDHVEYLVRIGQSMLRVRAAPQDRFAEGAEVRLRPRLEGVRLGAR